MMQPPERIDGNRCAAHILARYHQTIKQFKKHGITPHLAVVLVGQHAETLSTITRKEKVGKLLGIQMSVHRYLSTVSYQTIAEAILKLSTDPTIHGIVIERPLPSGLSGEALNKRITLTKDVDGLLEKSPHLAPIGMAIGAALSCVYFQKINKATIPEEQFSRTLLNYLKHRTIVLIGRGETGGTPIATVLRKYRMKFFMIHSETQEKEEFLNNADIVISAVGQPNIIKANQLKPGVIVLGVGLHKEKEKLISDYDENEIRRVASYYTTTNDISYLTVACLMQNVINACQMQTQ